MENKKLTVEKEVFWLAHAASKKVTRANLNGVYIDAAKSRAVATDGRIMAVRALDEAPETSVLLKCKPKAKLHKDATSEVYSLDGNANATLNPANSCEFDADICYPDIDKVIPAHNELSGQVVRLNTKLLYKLSQAMGCDEVELHLNNEDTKPLVVKDLQNENNRTSGVIMPIRK